jgi:hypothetical protein
MRNARHLISIASLALAACSDGALPTAPRTSAPSRPSASITDTPHGGSTGFYFLAPLVTQPKYSGTFDGTRSVVVQICALGGSATSAPAESCTGGNSLEVEVNSQGQHYHTNWKIDNKVYPSGTYYRLRVVDAANTSIEWAHADVFVGKAPAGLNLNAYVPIQAGTVPLKFRIEKGAQPGGGTGGIGGGSTGGGSDVPFCVANPTHPDCQLV